MVSRLMIRDGADINHPTRQGTNAVMLAAQLHNLEALVELLVMGGDLSAVDNEGFTALAYANALPLPTNMNRDCVGSIMEGDTDGPKKIASAEIIKMALACGVGKLRDALAENTIESSEHAIYNHFRFVRLLEKFGLTRMETSRHIHQQVATADWRIDAPEVERRMAQEFSETSSEQRDRESLEAHRARIAEEKAALDAEDFGALRCPMCTLLLPCPHFFKASALKSFFEKEKKENMAKGLGENLDSATKAMIRAKSYKLKMGNRGKEVLEEAHLGDRNTDRSIAFVNKYRAREIALDKQLEAKYEKQRKADERARAKQQAITEGTWVEWPEYYDSNNQRYWINAETDERWNECEVEETGRAFYVNPATKESRWESPIQVILYIDDDPVKNLEEEEEEEKEREATRINLLAIENAQAATKKAAQIGGGVSELTSLLDSKGMRKQMKALASAEEDSEAIALEISMMNGEADVVEEAATLPLDSGQLKTQSVVKPVLTLAANAVLKSLLKPGDAPAKTHGKRVMFSEEPVYAEAATAFVDDEGAVGEAVRAAMAAGARVLAATATTATAKEGVKEPIIEAASVSVSSSSSSTSSDITLSRVTESPSLELVISEANEQVVLIAESAELNKGALRATIHDYDQELIEEEERAAGSAVALTLKKKDGEESSKAQGAIVEEAVVSVTPTDRDTLDLEASAQKEGASPNNNNNNNNKKSVMEQAKEGFIGANPIPREKRKVYMFTGDNWNRFGQPDGLLRSNEDPLITAAAASVRLNTPNQKIKMISATASDDEVEAAIRDAKTKGKYAKAKIEEMAKAAAMAKVKAEETTRVVQISGWLFVSLSSVVTAIAPIERMDLLPVLGSTYLYYLYLLYNYIIIFN